VQDTLLLSRPDSFPATAPASPNPGSTKATGRGRWSKEQWPDLGCLIYAGHAPFEDADQGRLAGPGPLSASLASYGVLGCWRGPLQFPEGASHPGRAGAGCTCYCRVRPTAAFVLLPRSSYCRVRPTAAFVDGRGSPLAAGRTPVAGAGAPAASGSRSWCRRRGCRARPWRPPRGQWSG
jgi:hypothetical protein